MKHRLPVDLERFVQAQVRRGRFRSSDEAIAAAVRLLREREEAEEARVLEGIRQGLDDMRSGRGRPVERVFDEIRREFNPAVYSPDGANPSGVPPAGGRGSPCEQRGR